ncbi:unnamed protein product [Trichobilharzia szidati]|nr:unnamed protein product [Trichobilharzia szidati]
MYFDTKSSYPVRLRRVLVLTAPLWFRASFLLMRVFIRELFQDCVYVLRPSPGTKLEALCHPDPVTLKRDHYAWLQTALLRTGWLMTETEQATLPNGHRVQTAAAFFGPPSDSSGSISDSSDSEFRDDDDSLSNSQIDDDDLISIGDLDPFSLTGSYSGEAESSDMEECTPDVIMETLPTSNLEKINDINYNPKLAFSHFESRTYDQKRQTLSNSEHGGTPTPPTVAKRQQLTTTQNFNYPTVKLLDHSDSHPAVSRPSTVTASGDDHSIGFVEDVSSIRVDPVTPTADNSVDSPSGSEIFTAKQSSLNFKNAGEFNSSCSSTPSFFSTGSASVHSTKCSPTSDKVVSNLLTSGITKSSFEKRGSSKFIQKTAVLSTSKDQDLLLADVEFLDSTNFPHMRNKSAPLAQDEIGERTICNDENRRHIFHEITAYGFKTDSVDRSGNIPPWAVGRPQGESIHQYYDTVLPSALSSLNNNDNTTRVNEINSSYVGHLFSSSLDKFPECDLVSFIHTSTTTTTTTTCTTYATGNNNTCASIANSTISHSENDDHREALLLERQKTYDEIDANMIEINSTTSSSTEEISDIGDEEEEFEVEEEDDDDDDDEEEEEEEEGTQTINMQEHWMNPDELVQHIKAVGLNGLNSEYAALVKLKNDDTHVAFKHILNRNKNRYCDVICNDATRVYLQPLSNISGISYGRSNEEPVSFRNQRSFSSRLHRTHSAPISTQTLVKNYIHANWVDGYRQKNAFICTQGPLSETVGDFWQMIWDYHCPIIVMITKILEAQRSKCYLYWPDSENQKLYFSSGHPGCLVSPSNRSNDCKSKKPDTSPDFSIENIKCESTGNFTQTTLRLTNLQLNEARTLEHFAFFSWPDHGTPQTTGGLLDLLTSVQFTYSKEIERMGYKSYEDQEIPPPPVVVHCSAGIGRTGTYVTVDICTKWLADPRNTDHKINIPLTVSRVRSQRFGCVQVPSQYTFCYRAIIDFAVNASLLDFDKGQSVLNSLISDSNTQTSNIPTSSFYHHQSSLPRPFCGLIPNLKNDLNNASSTFKHGRIITNPTPIAATASTIISSISQGNCSSSPSASTVSLNHNRSPFHELLALFTPANLTSIKNSIRFRKFKDTTSSEFSTENDILDIDGEVCLVDEKTTSINDVCNSGVIINLTTGSTTINNNNMDDDIQDDSCVVINPHFNFDMSSSSSLSTTSSTTVQSPQVSSGLIDCENTVTVQAPFSRPVKPAIFNDDLNITSDKSKRNNSVTPSGRSTQSEADTS